MKNSLRSLLGLGFGRSWRTSALRWVSGLAPSPHRLRQETVSLFKTVGDARRLRPRPGGGGWHGHPWRCVGAVSEGPDRAQGADELGHEGWSSLLKVEIRGVRQVRQRQPRSAGSQPRSISGDLRVPAGESRREKHVVALVPKAPKLRGPATHKFCAGQGHRKPVRPGNGSAHAPAAKPKSSLEEHERPGSVEWASFS